MALKIETFSNVKGGNAFFKAVSHPLARDKAAALIAHLRAAGPVAIYDPLGFAEGLAEFHDLDGVDIAEIYVQSVTDLDATVLGRRVQPVTELCDTAVRRLFVAAFDAGRMIEHIAHLVPDGVDVMSLDAMRIPDAMLSRPKEYLHGENFATNFAFFRDAGGRHTRIVSANYWAGYGASAPEMWFILFGEGGEVMAEWSEKLAPGISSVVIDSAAVRDRFGLGDFTGQLFIHATGIRGHDVVKYALDIWSDDGTELSCSHDANAWPSERYAGVPAPQAGERVVVWVQNSHPCPIPAGAVGLSRMGAGDIAWLDDGIAPYATRELDVADLLPGVAWPGQIEIHAGKHFVRPRYEVVDGGGRRRIAHANVERQDLVPDPGIADLGNLMGKGYILPAPILPTDRWRSLALPTPMATCQDELPVAAILLDSSGREVARHRFGRLPRDHGSALDADELVNGDLTGGYGHMELVYDFADGGAADGWLHGLFRYEDRHSGHAAETSFGAHIFNTVLTYRNEPQSYINRPPGLSTRLFLRLGPAPLDTLCHLIYPASTPWHDRSRTDLILYDGAGAEVARRAVEIPCSGSYFWRYRETFDDDERARAGDRPYIVIRDTTCRLFGYHGLVDGNGAFSLDHMFGF